jgi:mono/diheme cytochrome c family protein
MTKKAIKIVFKKHVSYNPSTLKGGLKMRKTVLFIMAIVLSLSFLAMNACEKKKPEEAQVSVKTEAPDSEGAKLFKQHCEVCHGADGKGNIGPDLTDSKWKYGSSDDDLFASISKGRSGGMPAWENQLSAEKIKELIAYIRSIGGKK